ncbi:MAG: LysR family transcriptional regulator [Gammaproteobacteria bacterium]|nr:MAG: LysR family transcriptional regulator [Gammaproteobacteria bacterium]
MELADLKVFLTVARSGSFSRAAERLHLTQPAVSKRIAALESELGLRLFDRLGRRVLPTEAGAALIDAAGGVFAAVEEARRRVETLREGVGGRLALATSHHVGLHRLPALLRRFIRRHPQVELALRFLDSETACRAVAAGDCELAVVTLPEPPAPPFETVPLWRDPLVVVAAPDHPLATHPEPLAELERHGAVFPETGTYTRGLIDQALAAQGLQVPVKLESNYLETIRMLVAIGFGWSILPRSLLGPDLCAVAEDRLTIVRRLGVVRHRARTPSRAGEALLGLLREEREENPT